ncbi:carbohydrate ABC transporter permease [Paenibacillus psychroresistens]|uniref:Carbohydrate ABC transporter permease n=1 Tax=Paenibacillus psychroresistens TaxID=1778678 RepID=A0A6B8RF40_9BACL|nr:carbohydrate ABC transporter permease [Paenibacillus psychroresistens]QGQ94175.1 carbohydrate ABC transporter permease [Paenibacillus psychroresistens]
MVTTRTISSTRSRRAPYSWGKIAVYVMLTLCSYATLFPFINVLAVSLSSSRAVNASEVGLFPVEWNWSAYQHLIDDGQLLVAMGNSIEIAVIGTLLNILFTILAAYPLSKVRLRGRNPLLMLILFTMLFSGGMIPEFLLVKNLGIVNTYWSLWLPALISVYNMFVLKSFFEALPQELEESATVDGAKEMTLLLRIILPLSLPVLAALTLFYAVGWWNAYMNVLIYINSSDKVSLTVKLYQMLDNLSPDLLQSGEGIQQVTVTPEGIRSASVVIATLPILLIYPFLQKYFVKGVLMGSVKG